MTQPDVQRSGIQLDKIATMFVILVCLLGSVWIARDLAYGGTPPRVVAGNRARTPPPPPVEAAPLPKEPISIAGAATKGSPQAKVALVIYSDFECPFCARFANDTWPALDSKYVASGRVRVAFR